MNRQFLAALLGAIGCAYPQTLSVKWEELTAADFQQAVQRARSTCVLPFGIIEKHGPQLPLGTDLINVRYVAEHAAQQEYSVVFPAYYFGQIFEARHEPGTVAYSARLQMDLLQETTDEMARNGCKKIVIVNGHGGNDHLLPFFAQAQLATPHDYIVYVLSRPNYPPGRPALKSKVDQHAGESETAHTLVSRPDLVHLDRARPGVRRRSEPPRSAARRLHGDLVVCEIPQPLCGRRIGGDHRTGRVRYEGLDGKRSRCYSSREGGRDWAEAATRILRSRKTAIEHETVREAAGGVAKQRQNLFEGAESDRRSSALIGG